MNEFWERLIEGIGLALIKIGADAVLRKCKRPARRPTLISVQVPPEISNGEGGEVEVHWVGAMRVPGHGHAAPEEETKP